MRPDNRLAGNAAELTQGWGDSSKTETGWLAVLPRHILIGIVSELRLLRLSNRLSVLVCQSNLHPEGINTSSAPLRLMTGGITILIGENPDDLTDKNRAIPALVTLARRVPSSEKKGDGALLQQRTGVGERGIAQITIFLCFSHCLATDRTSSDLSVESPVRQVQIRINLAVLEAQLETLVPLPVSLDLTTTVFTTLPVALPLTVNTSFKTAPAL